MQVEIEIQRSEKISVEVEFPIFVKHGDIFDDGESYDTYGIIDKDLNIIEITKRSSGSWEYSTRRIDQESLGRIVSPKNYKYSRFCLNYSIISADEFNQQVSKMIAVLEALKPGFRSS